MSTYWFKMKKYYYNWVNNPHRVAHTKYIISMVEAKVIKAKTIEW